MTGRILQINIGRGGVPKLPVKNAYAGYQRITGDDWNWSHYKEHEDGSTGLHGRPGQAICLYSVEDLVKLQQRGLPVFPGALGENFTTIGLDSHSVRIGDIYSAGGVKIQITNYRKPCKTIAKAYGNRLLKEMFDKTIPQYDYSSPKWGMTGFYASVLQPGRVMCGDLIEILEQGPEQADKTLVKKLRKEAEEKI